MPKTKLQRRREKEKEKEAQKAATEESKTEQVQYSDEDEYYDEYGQEEDAVYTKEHARRDLQRIRETEDMFELIELTKVPDAIVRLKASQQMCPCRVKGDIKEFWERLFELSQDSDPQVRYQVLHNMCDGSPPHYENQIMECVENMTRDKDNSIRNKANKVIASYTRTGKWNIL